MADSVHQAVLELIPWYVNGTLAEREMDQVSGHVASCAACAEVVKQEVSMAQRVRAQPARLEELLVRQDQAFAQLQNSLPSPALSSNGAHPHRTTRPTPPPCVPE